jgi:hypothetical protein
LIAHNPKRHKASQARIEINQRARLQRSEQKRTFSQSFAHFLRHANGFSHAAHIFEGRSDFLTILGIAKFHI